MTAILPTNFREHLAEVKEREIVFDSAIFGSRASETTDTYAGHEYTEAEKHHILRGLCIPHSFGLGAGIVLTAIFIGFGVADGNWLKFTPTVGFAQHHKDTVPIPHMRDITAFTPFPIVFVVTFLQAIYHALSIWILRKEEASAAYYVFDKQSNAFRWLDLCISMFLLNFLLQLSIGIHDIHLWFALAVMVVFGNISYAVAEAAARPYSKVEHYVRDVLWLNEKHVAKHLWMIGTCLILGTWLIYFCYLGNLPQGFIQANAAVGIAFLFAWQGFVCAVSWVYYRLNTRAFWRVEAAYTTASVVCRVTITIQMYFAFV